jgi:hypothetical protein
VVYKEVMGIRGNVHWMAQNWNAALTKIGWHDWKYRLQDFVTLDKWYHFVMLDKWYHFLMLDKWYHFCSQPKSVSIATFKAFYVWNSFSKCIEVPDGKTKFTVT